MLISINKTNEEKAINVTLPGSKSLSNRLLMINAVGNLKLNLNGLSTANDTVLLERLLKSENDWNVEDAGAPMRFILTYAAMSGKKVSIDGFDRLRERPVKPLIRSLEKVGAVFSFSGKTNNLPLRVEKGVDLFDTIEVDASASSQFVSALMLSMPLIKGRKTIRIKGEISGVEYIKMTAGLMGEFGVETKLFSQHLHIEEGNYETTKKEFKVEPDWSSAQYVYMAAALFPQYKFFVHGLKSESLQGDIEIASLMKQIGVETKFLPEGIEINAVPDFVSPKSVAFNLQHTPDLAPSLVLLCALKRINGVFSGLDNLAFKESDRTKMLSQNLMKWNIRFYRDQSGWKLDASNPNWKPVNIDTQADHRLAMTFAFAATKTEINLDNTECVKKSFPDFWNQMSAMLKIGQ